MAVSKTGLDVGQLFAERFRLELPIGRGPMAEVFGVTHQSAEYALKVFLPRVVPGMIGIDKIRRAMAEDLPRHPAILAPLEVGEAEHLRYLLLPLLEGRSLRQLLAEGRLADPRQAGAIAKKLAGVIGELPPNVTLGTIKPENIFLAEPLPGEVTEDVGLLLADVGSNKILSFSKYASLQLAAGAPYAYMAPEFVASGGKISRGADIYSLGALLYEMLTGQAPRKGWTPVHKANRRLQREWNEFLTLLLAAKPEERLESPSEIADTLDELLRNLPAEPAGEVETDQGEEAAEVIDDMRETIANLAGEMNKEAEHKNGKTAETREPEADEADPIVQESVARRGATEELESGMSDLFEDLEAAAAEAETLERTEAEDHLTADEADQALEMLFGGKPATAEAPAPIKEEPPAVEAEEVPPEEKTVAPEQSPEKAPAEDDLLVEAPLEDDLLAEAPEAPAEDDLLVEVPEAPREESILPDESEPAAVNEPTAEEQPLIEEVTPADAPEAPSEPATAPLDDDLLVADDSAALLEDDLLAEEPPPVQQPAPREEITAPEAPAGDAIVDENFDTVESLLDDLETENEAEEKRQAEAAKAAAAEKGAAGQKAFDWPAKEGGEPGRKGAFEELIGDKSQTPEAPKEEDWDAALGGARFNEAAGGESAEKALFDEDEAGAKAKTKLPKKWLAVFTIAIVTAALTILAMGYFQGWFTKAPDEEIVAGDAEATPAAVTAEATPAPANEAEKARLVAVWVERAREEMARNHHVKPPADSALSFIERIEAMDPKHEFPEKAREIMLADYRLRIEPALTEKQFEKAAALCEEALLIRPNDPDLLIYKEQAVKNLDKGKDEEKLDRLVEDLLFFMNEKQFVKPEDACAFALIKRIEAVDPHNAAARLARTKIIQVMIEQSKAYLNGKKWNLAAGAAKDGLLVDSQNVELLDLLHRALDELELEVITGQPKEQLQEEKCPPDMKYIGPGLVKMGSALDDQLRKPGEKPHTPVEVAPFCIDHYEYPNLLGQVPLINVTWSEAKQYCEAQGKRLCTEVEWERSCKGMSDWRYPYGNDFQAGKCATAVSSGQQGTIQPAGKRFACQSQFGVYDLSGNVREWTSSLNEAGDSAYVLRGGAATDADWGVRCAVRMPAEPDTKSPWIGFRCCKKPADE